MLIPRRTLIWKVLALRIKGWRPLSGKGLASQGSEELLSGKEEASLVYGLTGEGVIPDKRIVCSVEEGKGYDESQFEG